MPTTIDTATLEQVAKLTQQAGVFEAVTLNNNTLSCTAKGEEVDATYYIEEDAGTLYVGLRTPDRWLSESIEADLMHTGDKMHELLEDELYELGIKDTLTFQHYRDEDKQYTFRSSLTEFLNTHGHTPQILFKPLLAYQAMFKQLGDMDPSED